MNTRNSKVRVKRWVAWVLGFPILFSVGAVLLCLGMMISFPSETWDLEKIEKYLQVSIPKDAQGLKYASGTNRNFYVELNFSAPPQSAMNFARHFCDGVLHKGYDPFNAINVGQPTLRTVKIDMIGYYTQSYYSYSPRTSQHMYGVFCFLYSGLYWVLVDESNPSLYVVKFKHYLDRRTIYNDVKPLADFPIMVRGLMPDLDGGYSSTRIICLDVDPDLVGGSDKKWDTLLGADIQISINDKVMTGAYVSADGRLRRKDGKNNYSDPDSTLFQYCLIVFRKGTHRMTIRLPSSSVGKTTFSWYFREEDSASCEDRYPDNDCY